MGKYNVVFNGRLVAGVNRAELIEAFSDKFGYQKTLVVDMLASRKPVVLKRNVDLSVAEKFQSVLRDMGMEVDIEVSSSKPVMELTLEPIEVDSQPESQTSGSRPEFEQKISDLPPPASAFNGAGSAGANGIASVDAGRGMYWITQGYQGFVGKALGAWIGAIVVYVVLNIVLSLAPVLGGLVTMLLSPVLIGGFMLGAKAQDEGQRFTVGHLFSAFNQHAGQLMLVGLLYMVGVIVIAIAAAIFVGGLLFSVGTLGSSPESLASLASNPGTFLLPILVIMLLVLPLVMAYWFAPALVVLSGLSATTAMAVSFKGCLKNIVPFLVYGILGLILAVVAAIPLFLGFLILAPVLTASMYVAWKDIFAAQSETFSLPG